ncbi:hypothetical protein DFH28DRAFT_586893 [Melampsora americana]|nr:hypothetical protein DFH28DRAFT_586893 [Melampsora americana]
MNLNSRKQAIQETAQAERINFRASLKAETSQHLALTLEAKPVLLTPQDNKADLKLKNPETTHQYLTSTSQLKRGREDERDQCPLCLQEFQVAHRVIKLPCDEKVSHIFHERCLWPWYSTHTTCPTCRREIDSIEKDSFVFWSESPTNQDKRQKTKDDFHM